MNEFASLPKDESLHAEWEAATGFDIHDRNMIWSNYCYFALKGDKKRMELEEKIMRSILAKLKLGRAVVLIEELRKGRQGEL